MSNKKKLLIAGIVLLFVAIPFLVFFLQKESTPEINTSTIIIDNQSQYSRGLDTSVFTSIANSTYTTVSLNIKDIEPSYHGTIRANSFNTVDNTVSFILDIPSIKLSFMTYQGIDNDNKPLSDALIECPAEDKIIYDTNEACVDLSTYDKGSVEVDFPLGLDLPLTGPNFSIDYTQENSKYTVFITYYTEAGKQEALDALISLGYNPAEYTITYQAG